MFSIYCVSFAFCDSGIVTFTTVKPVLVHLHPETTSLHNNYYEGFVGSKKAHLLLILTSIQLPPHYKDHLVRSQRFTIDFDLYTVTYHLPIKTTSYGSEEVPVHKFHCTMSSVAPKNRLGGRFCCNGYRICSIGRHSY